MKYFVYAMNGSAPSLVMPSSLNTRDWFFGYKWDVGGEAFVPVPDSLDVALPSPGDVMWFVMDEHPIGFTEVLEVREDTINSLKELVYDTQEIVNTRSAGLTYALSLVTGLVVDPEKHQQLLELHRTLRLSCRKHGPAAVLTEEPKSGTGAET